MPLNLLKILLLNYKNKEVTFLKTKTKEQTEDDFKNSLIKRNKKQNLTPITVIIFFRELCQIPGISIIKAKPIVDKYENIGNLIMAYESSGLTEDEKNVFIKHYLFN